MNSRNRCGWGRIVEPADQPADSDRQQERTFLSDEVILIPDPPSKNGTGLVATWHRTPLYARIMGGMLLGILAGIVFGEHVAALELPSKLILRLLGALAPPLILVAVVRALMHAEISGKFATRLIGLLILNTVVAIMIGLMVANVIQPGRHESLKPAKIHASSSDHPSLVLQFLDNVPKSLLAP
ncbi:MAG: cation:dicarboxylase symporter family transporter, partial [Armatimonadota bacterium]